MKYKTNYYGLKILSLTITGDFACLLGFPNFLNGSLSRKKIQAEMQVVFFNVKKLIC